MRQTIKDIEVNVAYRWFLGLDFNDPVPHFSTFGKNYKRRFEGTDLFEQIFIEILLQCMNHKLVCTNEIFVDATHIKAAANRKKAKKILVAKKSARFYDEKLKKEINEDRQEHGKKSLKSKDDDEHIVRKNEFVYDEYYDEYICPENKILTRHIWSEYIEQCEDIRLRKGMKELYALRKETIERCFGTAKEHHAMRYTQQRGKDKMLMKVGLTFACMNMKKLARILWNRESLKTITKPFSKLIRRYSISISLV